METGRVNAVETLFHEQLSEAELEAEKQKDYRNVVSVQVGLLILSLLCQDVLTLAGFGAWQHVTWWVFQLVAAIYMALLWDMLRNFTRQVWLLRCLAGLLVAVFSISLVVNNFLYTSLPYRSINVMLHSCVLGVEMLTIRLSLRDLLRRTRLTVDKLWASAAIYFMIGIAFANLFHIEHMLDPTAFGTAAADYKDYFEALYLSFTCLTSADNSLNPLSHLTRNLGLLEAAVGQLYLVLLISGVLLPKEAPPSTAS